MDAMRILMTCDEILLNALGTRGNCAIFADYFFANHGSVCIGTNRTNLGFLGDFLGMGRHV
jgi:hypothetical protein